MRRLARSPSVRVRRVKPRSVTPAQLPAFLREPVRLEGVFGPDGKVALLKREPRRPR